MSQTFEWGCDAHLSLSTGTLCMRGTLTYAAQGLNQIVSGRTLIRRDGNHTLLHLVVRSQPASFLLTFSILAAIGRLACRMWRAETATMTSCLTAEGDLNGEKPEYIKRWTTREDLQRSGAHRAVCVVWVWCVAGIMKRRHSQAPAIVTSRSIRSC